MADETTTKPETAKPSKGKTEKVSAAVTLGSGSVYTPSNG